MFWPLFDESTLSTVTKVYAQQNKDASKRTGIDVQLSGLFHSLVQSGGVTTRAQQEDASPLCRWPVSAHAEGGGASKAKGESLTSRGTTGVHLICLFSLPHFPSPGQVGEAPYITLHCWGSSWPGIRPTARRKRSPRHDVTEQCMLHHEPSPFSSFALFL